MFHHPFLTLAALLTTSKHWSVSAPKETSISISINCHHTEHIIYGIVDERLQALITFKTSKSINELTNLYGPDISAEPNPNSNRLKDVSTAGIINSNKAFMKSNFLSTEELN